jgi:hypothetical protein
MSALQMAACVVYVTASMAEGVVVGSNRSMAAYLDEIDDYTPALDVSEWPTPCGASASPPQPFNSIQSVSSPLT